jgi:hypothetical protein
MVEKLKEQNVLTQTKRTEGVGTMTEWEKELRLNGRHLDRLASELYQNFIEYGGTRETASEWLEDTRRVIRKVIDEIKRRYADGEEK